MATIRATSHWELPQIEAFLNECVIPVRLATLTKADRPLVCSLWYVYDGQAIWCATKGSANVAEFLTRTPDCGFEVAPEQMPYRGVRGQGQVEILPEEGVPLLLRLIDRYLGTRDSDFAHWLVEQATDEVAIRITPDWYTAWDFSGRMGVGGATSPG